MRKELTYAIYKADELLCVGTADECAECLGVRRKSIQFMASPTNARRNKGKRKMAYIIEEDK